MASRTDAGAARSRRRPGSLLWSLLLLLLPLPLLSAKAAATRQPGAPGLPRASDTTRGSQGTENGGELAAGGPQGSVGGAQGPFEAWGAEPAPEDTRNVRSGPSQTGSPRDDISRERLSPPFNLQESEVGLLENRLCNLLYGQRTDSDKYYIHEEMVCVGNSSTAKSICRGDSGGPLVCHLPNTWVLVGLASWGLDCRHPVYPSVFTRVSYFVDWINGIKRLTSSPDPASTPSYTYSSLPVRAAGSPGPYTALRAAQTWLLLSFILRASQKALM
uniref:Peptidase S1 domain-containing protein n=1 Tax=Oryctolagus cuniculus TaxID=9986 RepID=A0A5F9DUM6_RABIT